MYEIRFHGRGGQGAVMAAQTIAEAAVYEGLEAIAFPFFGAERRGAPIMAFARIDDKKISLRTQVYQPDMVVVMEESLIEIEPVADGLKPGGCAVVNSKLSPDRIDLGVKARCATVDATSIALEMLKAPIVNTAILGAMARADDFVSIKAVKEAIASRFGEHLGEEAGRINALAAQMAYEKATLGESLAQRPITKRKMWLPTWQEMPPGVALYHEKGARSRSVPVPRGRPAPAPGGPRRPVTFGKSACAAPAAGSSARTRPSSARPMTTSASTMTIARDAACAPRSALPRPSR